MHEITPFWESELFPVVWTCKPLISSVVLQLTSFFGISFLFYWSEIVCKWQKHTFQNSFVYLTTKNNQYCNPAWRTCKAPAQQLISLSRGLEKKKKMPSPSSFTVCGALSFISFADQLFLSSTGLSACSWLFFFVHFLTAFMTNTEQLICWKQIKCISMSQKERK